MCSCAWACALVLVWTPQPLLFIKGQGQPPPRQQIRAESLYETSYKERVGKSGSAANTVFCLPDSKLSNHTSAQNTHTHTRFVEKQAHLNHSDRVIRTCVLGLLCMCVCVARCMYVCVCVHGQMKGGDILEPCPDLNFWIHKCNPAAKRLGFPGRSPAIVKHTTVLRWTEARVC